jgi:hypothetical protein
MPKSTLQTRETPGDSRVLADLRKAFSNEPLSNALAMSVQMLRESSDHFDWVGIYLVRGKDLVLEAYAGDEETELLRIPIGQWNLWLRNQERRNNRRPGRQQGPAVSHVLRFNPIRDRGADKGTERSSRRIDIDSSRLLAFNQEDRETLEGAASLLARYLDGRHFESHDPSTL